MPDKIDGDFYFGIDHTRHQYDFLRSIEKEVPQSLEHLKDSVLPSFIADEVEREKGRKLVEGVWCVPDKSEAFWSAMWEWAEKWHLVTPSDVPMLKSRSVKHVAERMIADAAYRKLPAGMDWNSSATVFALATLAPVVFHTLTAWAKNHPVSELTWTIPAPIEPTQVDLGEIEPFIERYRGLLAQIPTAETEWLFLARDKDDEAFCPPVFDYNFKVKGWDPLREKHDAAKERILRELTQQLIQKLTDHKRIATMMGMEKHSRVYNKGHFDWLALHQVGEKSMYAIAKDRAEALPEYQSAKGRRESARERKTLDVETDKAIMANAIAAEEKTVAKGIHSAAELVIGPDWQSWIRGGRAGRRKQA